MLTEDDMAYPDTGDAIAQLKEVLEYSAIGGKFQQRLMVLITFHILVEPRKLGVDSLQWA